MTEMLKLQLDGEMWPAVQPAIEIILYSRTPREKVAPGFVAFYNAFFRKYNPPFKWFKTNVMKTFKTLPGSGTDQIKQMLTDKKSLKSSLLGVEQHSGPKATQVGLPAFEFFSEEELSDPSDPIHHSFIRICWPPSEAEYADDLFAFFLAAAAEVEFDSGYCGYSYYWDIGSAEAEAALSKVHHGWLTRFPGLAPGDPLGPFNFVDDGILGVSWVTLLGQARVEELGGREAIAKKLGTGIIEVKSIGHDCGLAIRAGDSPELGDVNRNQKLPLYKNVGQALAEVKVPDETIENLALPGMNAEQVVAWYNRFFED
jgi:hypothetical protein